jgi:hypothetical protein
MALIESKLDPRLGLPEPKDFMPDPEQTRHRNGDDDTVVRRGPRKSNPLSVEPPPPRRSSFLGMFMGAFAGVIVIAAIGGIAFLGMRAFKSVAPVIAANNIHANAGTISNVDTATTNAAPPSAPVPIPVSTPTPAAKSANDLYNVGSWQLGDDTAKTLSASDQPDIGWWTRTFYLPKTEAVQDYLAKEGLNISGIVPEHYEDTKDATTITYAVHAETTARLLKLGKMTWVIPDNPELKRFVPILIFNKDLPAGTMWNVQNAPVVTQPGEKLNFAWQVRYDKASQTATTDRLPFADNVFTEDQTQQFNDESAAVKKAISDQVQSIDQQVQADTQAKLSEVAADPPKPEHISGNWNHGNGSGEPTKSAERMGGGTVAGAAGGAAIGAAAGDAGMGAGIGAGVGLLGGFIYDTVSKNNDRERYQRKVAAENAERMDEWKGKVKVLDEQRDQIKLAGDAEKKQELDDLANRIIANKGTLDGVTLAIVPETVGNSDAPSVQPATELPTADQPSGPIMATTSPATDAALKQKLLGYWKSKQHVYSYTDDGWVHVVNGKAKNQWDIVGNIYHDHETNGHDYTYDILTLTDKKFVYRSRTIPVTYTLTRVSPDEVQNQ